METYCRVEQSTDDNMAHAHCMLDNYGYKHTLTMCNTCFSTATMIARTRLRVRFYVNRLSCFDLVRTHGLLKKDSMECVNPLTPKDPYSGRTAPLTSKRCILYIYSTNIGTGFLNMVYTVFFFFFFFKMQFVS